MKMLKLNKYTLIILATSVLALNGCGKEYFDELSTNPNQVSIATLPALLSTSTSKAGLNTFTVGSNTSTYAQYTANPVAASASDIYETIDHTGMWDAL